LTCDEMKAVCISGHVLLMGIQACASDVALKCLRTA
jgi:hypothetical protein